MSTNLTFPRLDCLPPDQRNLWPELREVPDDFVLYGGTALALHLGHRQSEDFDFFSSEPFDPKRLLNSLNLLKGAMIERTDANTLCVALLDSNISLSFFGGLSPDMLAVFDAVQADNGISVASVGDVFGCKCATIQSRATFKDYFDIWAVLEMTDYTLTDGLSFAAAIYGEAFDPHSTLYSLSYFDDLDKPLSQDKRNDIQNAVQAVDLTELPVVQPRGPIQSTLRGRNDK
ncbi:MAG: nucleotidyl transferase AbiEii/AbiGii toxin family protein [Candidatus Dadabacteria bacterium]|nr:nucleotidyl transferase AbiEii/AbiGii toxin family protein [Candidatus Dadabacteria bacterium]